MFYENFRIITNNFLYLMIKLWIWRTFSKSNEQSMNSMYFLNYVKKKFMRRAVHTNNHAWLGLRARPRHVLFGVSRTSEAPWHSRVHTSGSAHVHNHIWERKISAKMKYVMNSKSVHGFRKSLSIKKVSEQATTGVIPARWRCTTSCKMKTKWLT